MKKAFLFSLATIMSMPAFSAGSWTGVTVSQIESCTPAAGGSCATNGYVQVQLSANSTTPAGCVDASHKNWVVIDVTSAAGAYAAALFQSIKLSGTTVNITGTGSCTINGVVGVTETLAAVFEQ